MHYRVLGPVEIGSDDGVVQVGPAKERAVLSLLALRAGGVVSSSELIEALWWEDAPRTAHKTVQMYISNLRRTLGPDAIVTTPAGYRLTAAPEQVDACAFEQLVQRARQMTAAGEPEAATGALRQALALWRGAPVAELAARPTGAAIAARLEELRRGCEEDLAEARLSCGDAGDLVGELQAAVAAEPLRERRWSQLMRALYRGGRQVDALRTFQRLRATLADELGLEPSPELRALEQAILRHDPALSSPTGAPPVPAAPVNGGAADAPVGPAPLAGRHAVTVLFTDLVSSTALSATLGVEASDTFRRRHFDLLRDCVDAQEGTLVKNLGDGVMAAFATPSAALSCAAAMQQAVERDSRGPVEAQALRVGVATGEVTTEDGDYFGDPVVEASRLCDHAEAGQILVAELVRLMAGRHTTHDFSPVGELALKGLPEPVPTLRLNWLPLPPDEPAVLLPPQLSVGAARRFVGRAAEQERLVAAFEDAARGVGSAAFVAGEPGIGKTSLTAVVAREAVRRGATVLYGRCDEDLRIPYQPFVEALSHYVAHAAGEVLTEHVDEHGGELVRLVPALARRIPGCPAPTESEPEAERYLAIGAAVGLLRRAAAEAPLLVVLDDLHWADRPTLLLLREVGAALESSAICVLGTYRSSEHSDAHPLADTLADLHRRAGVVQLGLGGLTEDDVVDLAEANAGQELDQASTDLAMAVCRETAGNPFFVIEMMRHLAESGAVVRDAEGRWSADAVLGRVGRPHSVREVVAQRVRRLGGELHQALATAAVIGPRFDLDMLAEVAEVGDDAALDWMERAVGASLVTEHVEEAGRFSFSHALVQQTLYDELGALRRRRLHRRVAETLEARIDVDEAPRVRALAHHWERATEPARALGYARRAGELALAALAPDEAVEWFERALRLQQADCPDDVAARCDLLIGLGTARRDAGQAGHRADLLEAGELAHRAGDGARMAEAALAGYRGFWSSAGTVDDEKVAALRRALDHMDTADSPIRARILATLANELTFTAGLAQRRPLVDEAKAMAARLGDPATTVQVLAGVSDAIWTPSAVAERLADSAAAVALAARTGDPVARFRAANYRLQAAMAVGDVEKADGSLAALQELADEIGLPVLQWIATFARSCRALVAGDPGEAERLAAEALTIGADSGQPDAFILYGAGLVYVRWQQGRLDEVLPLMEQTAADNPGIPGYWAAVARARCETGDEDGARRLLDEAAAVRFAHLHEDETALAGLVMYAETAAWLRAEEAAAVLYDLLAPWRAQVAYIGVAVDGPVSHFLGGLATTLGRPDAAEGHFAAALELGLAMGAAFFTARTQLEWARLLAERAGPGDLERTRMLLRAARAGATSRGYAVVARRADAAASALSGLSR